MSAEVLEQPARVVRETGVVERFGQVFGSATAAHVDTVRAKTRLKQFLRQGEHVAPPARPFEAVEE